MAADIRKLALGVGGDTPCCGGSPEGGLARHTVPSGTSSPCSKRRYVFLLSKKTCLLVGHEDMSSFWTRRHVFLLDKKTFLLATQEDMSSCVTIILCHKKACLLVTQEDTCLLVTQEDRSSGVTRRRVFPCHKKMLPSCVTRRHRSLSDILEERDQVPLYKVCVCICLSDLKPTINIKQITKSRLTFRPRFATNRNCSRNQTL